MDGQNNIIDIDKWVDNFVVKYGNQSDEEFEAWLNE